MEKMHPSFGKSTKGKGGSRTVDHPNMGKAVSTPNNTGLAKSGGTSHAFGKPAKFAPGAGKKSKDPGVKTYAQGPQGKQAGGY